MQTVISREEIGASDSQNSDGKHSALTANSTPCGKMTLYIKSKRKYMGTQVVGIPAFVPGYPPLLVNNKRRIAVYEDYLDEEQSEAVKYSKVLAANLCIDLEVHDVSRSNFFMKFMGLFFRTRLIPKTPSLSFANEGMFSLISSNFSKMQTISDDAF